MIFHYQALNKKGDNISDYVDASSESTARQKIRSQGLYLVKIQKHGVSDDATDDKRRIFRGIADKLSNLLSIKLVSKQIGIFSRQLATLLKAGMPLPLAISNIIEQIDNKFFKNIITDVKEKIEEGSTFSNALELHKNVFYDMYINMVRVGENLGSLDHVMERLAEMEDKKNILKNKNDATQNRFNHHGVLTTNKPTTSSNN